MKLLRVYLSHFIKFTKQNLHKPTLRGRFLKFLYENFSLKILTREALATDQEQYHTTHFGQESLITTQPAKTIGEIPAIIQPLIGEVHLHQPFVAEVDNAQLVGSTAVAIDSQKNIVMETVMPNDYGRIAFEDLPARTLILKEVPAIQASEVEVACSLVNIWGRTVYAHWILDCLTRLEGYEYYQQKTGYKPLLIIHANPKSWQVESLKLLGYEPDNYIQWKQQKLKVKKLIVPSFRRQDRWTDYQAIDWMRSRMISNLPPANHETLTVSPRIFISRANAVGRQIVNEDEVMKVLTPLGFVSYALENMSFADEVRLFSQAEFIIATHGSGLTNMVFSRKKPVIIDLFEVSWYTQSIFKLANSLNFPYTCLQCQPVEVDFSRARGNIIVDIDKLKQLIEIATSLAPSYTQ